MNTKKMLRSIGMLLVTFGFMNGSCITMSQDANKEDKTLSPYFKVMSDNVATDALPLKSTDAEVNIAGVIADVKVTQVYKNEGKSALEAIYVFPASTRAAVYSMKMTIGERTIVAKIKEKQQARQDYEQAKAEGKTASLLEQHRPNVFQMNVANILPGDEIKVEMNYTELLVPEDGVYEFVYPTVVGPRFTEAPEEGESAESWTQNPYLPEGTKPTYNFNINVTVAAGMPVKEIKCPSHNFEFEFLDKYTVSSGLIEGNEKTGNKDVIIRYRLQGNKIESGLLLYEGEEENFFLTMIQPPERVKQDEIPPREYVFIVDVSGSMYGFPLDVSKKVLKELIGNLKPTDRFNVLLFAGGSRVMSENSIPANPTNIKRAINLIDNQQGGGGTRLLPALQRAFNMKGTENYSRTFVAVTDGYVSVEKEAFDLIRNNLNKANFFAFGIGSSVNRHLIDGMANVGKGESFVITGQSEAPAQAEKFRKYIQSPVLTNIKAQFSRFDAYDVEPVSIPDVLAQRPILIYGKYKGKAKGSITINGTGGADAFNKKFDVSKTKPDKKLIALKYLWARERIRLLDDYTNLCHVPEHKEEITNLGLKYNLLTNYTSFVAIDSEVRNEGGEQTTVNQPLPLPEGVSNYATGNVAGMAYGATKRHIKHMAAPKTAEQEVLEETMVVEDDADKQDVLSKAAQMPQFPGGRDSLQAFFDRHLRIPVIKGSSPVIGKVFLSFVVEKDGSVTDIQVVRSLHPAYDKEAIRVLKLTSKKWIPGQQNGKKVKVKVTIPVAFN